ncbi:hypothetical protein XENTR_v10012162 [Xenopus tropicalis]|nr:hypothetical protein XENTR_v10012162 [Xenopus tropicalis]
MAAENSKTIRKLIYIMKNNSSNSYKMSNDCDTKHNKYIETKEKTIKALLSPLCIIHNNKIRSIGDKEVAEDCQKKETISITPSDIMIQTNVDGNVQTCITKLSEETKLLLNDATTRKGEELELKEPRCDLNHHPPPCSTSTVSVIQRTCDSGKEKCACYASTEKISKVRMRELKSGIVRIFPLSGKENTFQRQDFWGFPAFLPHNLKTSFHFHNSSHSRTQKSGKRNQSATNQVSNHQDQRKQLSGMNQAGSQATLAMLNAIRNRLQQNNAKVMLGRKQKPLGMMLQRTLSNHNQEGE